MKNFIKTYLDFSKPENIIYISCVCVFLPYQISAVLMLAIVGYILVKKDFKKEIFCHTGSWLIIVFSLLTVFAGLYHKNYFGIFVSCIFFLIFILALYIRTVMTSEIFEKALSCLCAASIGASAVILFEKIIYFNSPTHRCYGDFFGGKLTSFYFSPTYLGTCMAMVALICAYKVILRKGNMYYYYLTAILSMLTMYFGGSMFIWVNVFAGLATFLFLSRHRKLLGALFVACAAAGVALFFVPDILPRLSESMLTTENRLLIWNLSVESFPQSPFFGQGFQTYGHIALNLIEQGVQGIYPAFHAHNIILEPLLSFGVIGTAVLFAFLFVYFQKLFLCSKILKRSYISILILSVTAGTLVHCIIDMTMLWIQPMIMYVLVFGGLGAEEKAVGNIFLKRNNH